MKTTRSANRFASLSIALVAVFVSAAASRAGAQEQNKRDLDYDWGVALLQDFGYYDMADSIFDRMRKSSDKDKKVLGLRGIAKLKRVQAQRSEDLEQRQSLNDEAVQALREVSATIRQGTRDYYDTLFDLADILQDIANESIDQLNLGRVPSDKVEAARAASRARLDEAETIFFKVKNDLNDKERDEDYQLWYTGVKGRLAALMLLLNKAELLATDSSRLQAPERVRFLHDARTGLDDFMIDYADELIGYVGTLWYGRVLQALAASGERGITHSEIEGAYISVYDNLIFEPVDEDEEGNPIKRDNFMPPPEFQDIAQRAVWWLFKYQNEAGRTSQTIAFANDRLLADWAKFKLDWSLFGRLALNELAVALHAEGKSEEALKWAGLVSERGGYPGQEADKVMSVIISTAQNKQKFSPSILASGANGAYALRKKDRLKAAEAIHLYQNVIANLDQVKDADEKAVLGREAWWRIGNCYAELGRRLEAARAFELGYKAYNNDKLSPEQSEQKLNERLGKNWQGFVGELYKESSTAALKAWRDESLEYYIKNPPVGSAVSTDGLAFQRAVVLARQKKYDEARSEFDRLAGKQGPYQERAMVELATLEYRLLFESKETTAAQWVEGGARFQKFLDYVKRTPESDAARLEARATAMELAQFYFVDCLAQAADKEQDVAVQRAHWETIETTTRGFADATTNEDIRVRSRYLRFKSLVAVGKVDEAEPVYDKLVAESPSSKEARSAGLEMGRVLQEKAEGMPVRTPELVAARNAVMLRSADAYRAWLEADDSSKVGVWAKVYNLYYDIGAWQQANDILDKAIAKFESDPKEAKYVSLMKRKLARCVLELAMQAYSDDDKAKTEALFARAAASYRELVGPENKAPATVLEEAALVFGGFLAGPNKRGNYVFYPGTGEFIRAAEMWNTVERYQGPKIAKAKDEKESEELRKSVEQAKFYKILTYYQDARARSDVKAVAVVRKNIDALRVKTNNRPGAPWFTRHYDWLYNQL